MQSELEAPLDLGVHHPVLGSATAPHRCPENAKRRQMPVVLAAAFMMAVVEWHLEQTTVSHTGR